MQQTGKGSWILLFLGCVLQTYSLHSLDLNIAGSTEANAANGLSLLVQESSVSMINPTLVYEGVYTSTTNLFSFSELFLYQIALGKKFHRFGLAAGIYHLDYLSYQESMANLTINTTFQNFIIGSNIRYLYSQVEQFHQAGKLIFDAALTWFTEYSTTTLVYKNLLHEKMLNRRLPVFVIWETCFPVSELVKIGIGLEKQHQEEFIFKLGTRCQVQDFLALLISCQQEPARLGAGIILSISDLNISYSIRSHQYLPYSHSISISYDFTKS